jgi:hypothetical protein
VYARVIYGWGKRVSLIGSLEQFDLANILRRIEVFAKTGLLVVKQRELWIEFYFRQGQLVCIGPVRSNATLIDRLVQAKLLSSQALPQVRQAIGPTGSNETQVAFALIKEGHLSREMLRAWFAHETSQILQTIFSWQTGEIYFEDERPTPGDRLLVGLSVSMLLDTLPASVIQTPALRSASASAPSTNEPVSPQSQPSSALSPDTGRLGQISATQLLENVPSFAPSASAPGSLNAAQLIEQSPAFSPQPAPGNLGGEATGLFSASQLIDDISFRPSGAFNAAQLIEHTPPVTFAAPPSPSKGLFGSEIEVSTPAQSSLTPPQPIANPLPSPRIDTSFMTPELVLVPVDLSPLHERNPQVQLTPDQWRLFALIDGQTSLQALCQVLRAPSEVICTLAGELIGIGLVMPLTQSTGTFNELALAGMNNAPVPVQSASYTSLPNWPPQSQLSGPMSMPYAVPVETQSQWGNGNNGATFMVGGGWMLNSKQGVPQSSQPSAAYAPVGGYR